jgi:rubrerythrin
VAQALTDGAALQIEGGTFRVVAIRWHCEDCGHRWEIAHGSGQGEPEVCPACGSRAIRERSGGRRRHSR